MSVAAERPSGWNALPSSKQFGVELSGSPRRSTVEPCDIHAEQRREDLQARRERRDRADVQIAIGPTVQPAADAGRKRIIDDGVTQRALNADRIQTIGLIEESGQAHHRVETQQFERHRRIVEVHASGAQCAFQLRRQCGRHRP